MPEKMRKTLAGHELGKNLFKEDVWGNIMSGKDNILIINGRSIDKRVKVS